MNCKRIGPARAAQTLRRLEGEAEAAARAAQARAADAQARTRDLLDAEVLGALGEMARAQELALKYDAAAKEAESGRLTSWRALLAGFGGASFEPARAVRALGNLADGAAAAAAVAETRAVARTAMGMDATEARMDAFRARDLAIRCRLAALEVRAETK